MTVGKISELWRKLQNCLLISLSSIHLLLGKSKKDEQWKNLTEYFSVYLPKQSNFKGKNGVKENKIYQHIKESLESELTLFVVHSLCITRF